MSIQKICKRLTKNDAPLSLAMSLLRPPAFIANSHFKLANFCTEIATPSTTADRGVATQFLIDKCGLTPEDIAKSFRHCSHLLHAKSSQNMEQVLKLLNGWGLTTPAQIRAVVSRNPCFFFSSAETNIQSKLSLLGDFMKKEHISKLIYSNARFINLSEEKLRSTFSLLQKLGAEGEALSQILALSPHLLTASEEKITDSFKHAEDLGFKKGSKMFQYGVVAYYRSGKEKLDRNRQVFSSLGFSEQEVLCLIRYAPFALTLSEEKLKRNMDFLVKTVGLPVADIVKYPTLFGQSLETRLIPRYRVMEALKSMQVQVSKKTWPRFLTVCSLTEKLFLERYVNSNAEFSSVLQDIYCKAKAGKLIIGKGHLQ